jgi:catechol 2,3-dioxygenase-like lactoylglutathione lyase family enzyme
MKSAGVYIHPHIAITVDDIEKTKDFYRKIGFKVEKEMYSTEKSRRLLLLRGYGFEMEIFRFDDQPPDQKDVSNLQAIKMHHFALPVRNLEETKSKLLAEGVPLSKDIQTSSSGGVRFLNIEDPSGFTIEFFELHESKT